MKSSFAAVALLGAASTASLPAHAQGVDPCTQIIVYAVQQFCSLMPNGQSLCQPVALTGPGPTCKVPEGTQFKPIPLAPPSVQFPTPNPMAMPAPFPAMPSAPMPYRGSPISPFTAQSVSPFGPQPFQFVPPQQAPALATAPAPVAVTPPAPAPALAAPTTTGAHTPPPADAKPMVATVPPVAAPEVAPQAATTPEAKPASVAVSAAATEAPAQPAPAPVAVQAASPEPEPMPANLPEAPSLPAIVAEAVALFPFDSAELTPLGQETLSNWLATAPVGMPVVVYGYADRLGPEDYNMDLSQRRADAARSYLISHGKDARDIRSIGKGEADPVKRCKGGLSQATIDCLAPNRRVHITHD